jgi:hypothetical protein
MDPLNLLPDMSLMKKQMDAFETVELEDHLDSLSNSADAFDYQDQLDQGEY